MMGHIHILLIEMAREDKGEEGVARLFEYAGLPAKKYVVETIYPEEEFQAIFLGAQKLYGVNSEDAEIAFAHYFMKVSPTLSSWFFKLAPDAKTFLERIPQIHKQFPAASSQEAFQEKLMVQECGPDYLIYRYDSPNRLCILLRTIADLVLKYYGERGEVSETACLKRGAPYCNVIIRFFGKANRHSTQKGK